VFIWTTGVLVKRSIPIERCPGQQQGRFAHAAAMSVLSMPYEDQECFPGLASASHYSVPVKAGKGLAEE
jgi:hypothetical protein